ncbi:MAG: hypothetical protein KDB53_07675, partial [Planctomycetes bacterium]|nr:hypothetical protein [Planctomycetota bacterium]
PMFMDPANGDFHLSPGSPAIDAGTLNPMTSSLELDRMPRVVFGTVDQGCFESGDVRANPAMAGNIPPMAPPGGATTEDVLEVNGSAGGASREVTIPLGTPFSFAVQAPTMGSGVAPFVIFMRVGEPDPTEDFMITGIGPMVFWPCPAASYLQPILVTLADSLNVPGCNPVFAASPAPWVSPLIPGISFPVTTTVQGVVRVTAGQFAVTNGVVVQVR